MAPKKKQKIVQTISDGPTISLLSQNKILRRSLRSSEKNDNPELLKTKILSPKKSSKIIKKKNSSLDEIKVSKMSNILLKKKIMNKGQINKLMKLHDGDLGKLVILLKNSMNKSKVTKKHNGNNSFQNNEWSICSNEEVEENITEIKSEANKVENDDEENAYVEEYIPEYVDIYPLVNTSSDSVDNEYNVSKSVAASKTPANVHSKDKQMGPKSKVPIINKLFEKKNKLHIGDTPKFQRNVDITKKVGRLTVQKALEQIKLKMMKENKQKEEEYIAQEMYYCSMCDKQCSSLLALQKHQESWLHYYHQGRLEEGKNIDQDSSVISDIKKEIAQNISKHHMKNKKQGPNSVKQIVESIDTFNVGISSIIDTFYLILNNAVEDDEDAVELVQIAIGATNVEMEALKKLAENAMSSEYVYDVHNANSNEGTFDPNDTAVLIEEYRYAYVDVKLEDCTTLCPAPLCGKIFNGMIGLQTHIKYHHKGETFQQKRSREAMTKCTLKDDEIPIFVCFVCKQMFVTASSRDDHVLVEHKINNSESQEAKTKLLQAFGEIFENTLKRRVIQLSMTQEDTKPITIDKITPLDFANKLKDLGDGARAFELLLKLKDVTNMNEDYQNFRDTLLAKLNKILGKFTKSSLLPITTEIVINSKQQHNVFNSDPRERPFTCPVCKHRFLTSDTRNKHLARTHGPKKHKDMISNVKQKIFSKMNLSHNNTNTQEEPRGSDKQSEGDVIELKVENTNLCLSNVDDYIIEGDWEEENEMIGIENETISIIKTEVLMNLNETPSPNNVKMGLQISSSTTSSKEQVPPKKKKTLDVSVIKNLSLDEYLRERTSSNKLSCSDCNIGFINETDLFHHNRLVHQKLEALTSTSTISPIKPVAVITSDDKVTSNDIMNNITSLDNVNIEDLDNNGTDNSKNIQTLLTRSEFRKLNNQKQQAKLKELENQKEAEKQKEEMEKQWKLEFDRQKMTQDEMEKQRLQQIQNQRKIDEIFSNVIPIPAENSNTEDKPIRQTCFVDQSLLVKPGPRKGTPSEILKRKALDLIKQLDEDSKINRRKRKKPTNQEDELIDEDDDDEDNEGDVDDAGVLLSNKAQWKRVADVVGDYDSSGGESEDDVEVEKRPKDEEIKTNN